MFTRYRGAGDINESTSYECADRQDPLDFASPAL